MGTQRTGGRRSAARTARRAPGRRGRRRRRLRPAPSRRRAGSESTAPSWSDPTGSWRGAREERSTIRCRYSARRWHARSAAPGRRPGTSRTTASGSGDQRRPDNSGRGAGLRYRSWPRVCAGHRSAGKRLRWRTAPHGCGGRACAGSGGRCRVRVPRVAGQAAAPGRPPAAVRRWRRPPPRRPRPSTAWSTAARYRAARSPGRR